MDSSEKIEKLLLSQKIAKEENEQKLRKFCNEKSVRGNYLRLVPKLHRLLFYKLYCGEKSYSKALKAKCLDCSQYCKAEIKNCKVITCPLWELRPYQEKEND